MNILDWLSYLLVVSGGAFFFAGTLGLLRFPDVYTRLHALTKADNLGLGLVSAGVILQSESFAGALKVLLIWLLVLLTSSSACYLVAAAALRSGVKAWRRP